VERGKGILPKERKRIGDKEIVVYHEQIKRDK
jgi:hypothetical protein